MQRQLRLQEKHYVTLKEHLFPGDGKEAVAVLLCGRYEANENSILLSHDLILIPHSECDRAENHVRWRTERLFKFFELVEKHNFAIVKIHSHPTGYANFSSIDDDSDTAFFTAAFNWSETNSLHASLVMLPNGKMFGRVFTPRLTSFPIDRISVAGNELCIWDNGESKLQPDSFAQRTIQAFGEGTYAKLKKLKIGVVGCSGTGSPTIEQLVRLGVGSIFLIDPDEIEDKNLNRIINSKQKDIGRSKVEVLAEVINNMGLGTTVRTAAENLFHSRKALCELITCDVIFGCVDSIDGRHLLSQLTNFYLIPYFDLGVRLIADKKGGVKTVVGSVNYIQPGMSSLFSRGVYTQERLAAESMKRTDPSGYQELVNQKYIEGVDVDRPAVISVNMLISSIALMEFLNRIHPFKDDDAANYARIMIDYCGSCIENRNEDSFPADPIAVKWAGRGDCKPFLRMPELNL
ncbi:ThiF family adenylyltransferase [Fulvivirgaceae bacterium PWU4]|uniref:ThiF family adenylyltransferase n=1 Tax=Chryseosolibacter histidini TaxID=2782349 RepID=A0AAP2DL31_9BACT|nr:ThiF family adenylyltransferase [Chryseosolibacter histidini]MBT1697142.1 ThiF family adenylyltransferase [Chryseosolibacter histidini]